MADGDVRIIPTDPDNPYPLGRHQSHDPRNRLFRALDTPLAAEPPQRTRPWYTAWVGDQGSTSACTAYSAVGVCRTQPNTARFTARHYSGYDTHDERFNLYRAAQLVDPWDGDETTEPVYEGSSTDAPFRVLRDRGHIAGWRWLFGLDETLQFLRTRGPVSVGTVWKRDMFHPRPDGTITATGGVVGGHAYRLIYADDKNRRVVLCNSWGTGWARAGRAYLSYDDLGALLADDGEAVVAALPA